jgi:hypothetical protein
MDYMYAIYVWKLNQTVLELDFRAVKLDVIRNNKCIVIKLWINNLQVDTDDHDCDLDLEEVLNYIWPIVDVIY